MSWLQMNEKLIDELKISDKNRQICKERGKCLKNVYVYQNLAAYKDCLEYYILY